MATPKKKRDSMPRGEMSDDDAEAMEFTGPDVDEEGLKEIADFVKQLNFDQINVKQGKKPEAKREKGKVKKDLQEKSQLQEGSNQKTTKKQKKKKVKQVQVDQVSSTTLDLPRKKEKLRQKDSFEFKPRSYFLIKPERKWFENTDEGSDPKEFPPTASPLAEKMKEMAERLLGNDIEVYKKRCEQGSKKSDFNWIRTVQASGTLPDRMAAYTVLIQDSAVHNLAALKGLIKLVDIQGKRQALMAVDTLKELFLSDLLLEDRKLRRFEDHPLTLLDSLTSGNKDSRDKHLILWYFEDQLKLMYSQFISCLDILSRDTIEKTKQKAVGTMYELLAGNPEMESTLLPKLVNKMGDPVKSVAAKTLHCLRCLLEKHPNMKHVVMLEVERLMYRPNISKRAQYYSLCFLNQIVFDSEDYQLAAKLIGIYFSFFKACVKKGDVDSKMMSGLLTGVNRAFPYAETNMKQLTEHVDTMHKIIHLVNFNISIQALMLLYQITDAKDSLSERFYSALYRKVLDPQMSCTSRPAMLLNLLYKAMQNDQSDNRVKAFVKRLLQVAHYMPPTMICGILFLISEIIRMKPKIMTLKNALPHANDEEDEEEHYCDVDHSDEDEVSEEKPLATPVEDSKSPSSSSWHHGSNLSRKGLTSTSSYTPTHRNPIYAGAEHTLFYELHALSCHFHPSVSIMAKNLLSGNPVQCTGDPLQDYTLIRFLDRFVFRNPKKSLLEGRQKMFAPKASTPVGTKAVAVTSEEFVQREEGEVPADDMFFYRYFQQKQKVKSSKGGEEDDSDADSVGSDEFEQYLEKMAGHKEDDDLDFATDVRESKKKGKGKDEENEDEMEDEEGEDEDEMEDEVDSDGEEAEFENEDEDLEDNIEASEDGKDDMTFDDDDAEFSDDSTMAQETSKRKKQQGRKGLNAKKMKLGLDGDLNNLFMSAEEFSNVLEENSGSKVDTIGTNAMANKDRAGAKQLHWEASRENWIKGNDWRSKRNFKSQKGQTNFNHQRKMHKQGKRR